MAIEHVGFGSAWHDACTRRALTTQFQSHTAPNFVKLIQQ
jgi:hypothetical protein